MPLPTFLLSSYFRSSSRQLWLRVRFRLKEFEVHSTLHRENGFVAVVSTTSPMRQSQLTTRQRLSDNNVVRCRTAFVFDACTLQTTTATTKGHCYVIHLMTSLNRKTEQEAKLLLGQPDRTASQQTTIQYNVRLIKVDRTQNYLVISNPENHTLEPNTKCIGSPVAEI